MAAQPLIDYAVQCLMVEHRLDPIEPDTNVLPPPVVRLGIKDFFRLFWAWVRRRLPELVNDSVADARTRLEEFVANTASDRLRLDGLSISIRPDAGEPLAAPEADATWDRPPQTDCGGIFGQWRSASSMGATFLAGCMRPVAARQCPMSSSIEV
jgi:hypothetical protein